MQGFRTGYLYRQPLLRNDQQPRTKYDVEIPPSATSGALSFEEDKWLSPLKKLVDGKKTQDKLRWVNSPNMYQKVEMGETGEQDPKKVTKVRYPLIYYYFSLFPLRALSLPCLTDWSFNSYPSFSDNARCLPSFESAGAYQSPEGKAD